MEMVMGEFFSIATKYRTANCSDANLEILRQLLDFCYQNNIETKIFFTPMHAFFLDLWFHIAAEDLWIQLVIFRIGLLSNAHV